MYLYTMEFSSAIMNNQFFRKMGRTVDCHVKQISQTQIHIECFLSFTKSRFVDVCVCLYMYVCMYKTLLGLGAY